MIYICVHEKSKKMISVKQATDNSVNFLKTIDSSVEDILVEEVEFDTINQEWLITLSFSHLISTRNLSSVFNEKTKYKNFKVDSLTGEVLSMKIRQLSAAQ